MGEKGEEENSCPFGRVSDEVFSRDLPFQLDNCKEDKIGNGGASFLTLPSHHVHYLTLQVGVHAAAAHPIADSPEGRTHDRSLVFCHLAPPLKSLQLLFLSSLLNGPDQSKGASSLSSLRILKRAGHLAFAGRRVQSAPIKPQPLVTRPRPTLCNQPPLPLLS